MLFSSMIFIWLFLPVVLIGNYILNEKYSNYFLLISSIIFYSWGEPKYIFLMLFSITINYFFGKVIGTKNYSYISKKSILIICIFSNLSLLFYFKYFNLFAYTINKVTGNALVPIKNIILPIGISFYTFQALSYVVDVYRGSVLPQKKWHKLALYISFFPQLIAGPIVRYKDIQKQIDNRTFSWNQSAIGVKRFIYGLGKKVLIANSLAVVVDKIFASPIEKIGTYYALIGIIFYFFQIYYDFSGYSDMAIGLGKLFGFDFMENFNYPYCSGSIHEFWKRWHISLSSWFKEYVYIPLGGNRKGFLRTYLNLIIVFLLTGLWHGASYNFIAWGLYNGIFLIVEKAFLGKYLNNTKIKIINHIYVIIVVLGGWILFRAPGLFYAFSFVMTIIIPQKTAIFDFWSLINIQNILALCAAILLCGPLQFYINKVKKASNEANQFILVEVIGMFMIFALSIIQLVSGSYNPFIYFRF